MIIDDFSVQRDGIRFVSVRREQAGLSMSWNSKPDLTYAVEATETLEPNASWLPVGTAIVSGGDTTSFVDPVAGSPAKFYRVRLE